MKTFYQPRYFDNGKEVALEDLARYEVIVPGARLPETGEGLCFTTEAEFLSWAGDTPQADTIKRVYSKIHQLRQMSGSGLERYAYRKRTRVERIVIDMVALAAETSLPLDSRELFDLATNPTDPLLDPIFDPISLFSSTGARGFLPLIDWLPLGGGAWQLAWFNWNNRPRSIRWSGWAALFDGDYWDGRSAWTGWIPMGIGDLSDWGMDSNISSVFVA